ncbi:MAG TPA: tetratricopeptide repeat protein [Terriglobales bacterium]|nr:tetratricopeptide repeat protein [Terriglobales bacterium]
MSRVLTVGLVFAFAFCTATSSSAQVAKGPSQPSKLASSDKAATLAETGHCDEALPLLKKSIRQTAERDTQKRLGLDGLHCAMTHGAPYDSLEFLDILVQKFPHDPEVLYAATHAFSDLSLRTSQDLIQDAPFSYQIHELKAEAFESQGNWQQAAAEYQKILDINPQLPSVHARLGRALLSMPQPSPDVIAEVKKNFEQELEIDPRNASAEYVLGDLAKDDGDLSAAVRHFSRATKLDAGFADAYLGLGTALVSNKQFTEAISPLETYEQLAPDSPTGHYELALAYSGVGRKEDANREASLQRQSAQALEQTKRRVSQGMMQQNGGQEAQTPEPK